jgi:hypothetical protein
MKNVRFLCSTLYNYITMQDAKSIKGNLNIVTLLLFKDRAGTLIRQLIKICLHLKLSLLTPCPDPCSGAS